MSLDPPRILLVDSDKAHRDALASFLREAGYEVLTSADGLDGWRTYQSHHPDLVLLDLLLSELTGYELSDRISRAQQGPERIPVILMSDFTSEAEWMTEPFKTRGISRSLSKPVRRKELLTLLSELGIGNPPQIERRETLPPSPPPPPLLPALAPSPSPPPALAPADNIVSFPLEEPKSDSPRLLLADDNLVTTQIVRRAFCAENFQVAVASTGHEAESLLETHRPDVVLLDINLPGRNGFEIFAAIRRNPALSRTSVIFLREPFEKINEEELKSCPASGLIQKPLKSSDWVRTVKDILGKRS